MVHALVSDAPNLIPSPTQGLRAPRGGFNPLTRAGLDAVLKAAENFKFYHSIFFTLARAGMRPSEARALKIDAVNFEDR
jgi:integrase